MNDNGASTISAEPRRASGRLVKPAPVILIDSREQTPLAIEGFPVERVTLPVGDYGLAGFSDWNNPQFIVERKSLDDLVSSLTHGRERFLREVEALRRFRFAALLIEAERAEVEMGAYRSAASPVSILASLDCLEVRAGVHVLWAGEATGAARRLEGLVRQFARGVEKDWRRLCRGFEQRE